MSEQERLALHPSSRYKNPVPLDTPGPPPTTPRLALVTGSLAIGGTTTFLCNLAGELVRRAVPVEVLSFYPDQPLASDFEQERVPVFCCRDTGLIIEDWLLKILAELRRFQPTAVVATLGSCTFEVLRYLPAGVLRLGAVQSDDPKVYSMAACYGGHLDGMAAVSLAIQQKIQAMPEFTGVPAHYLPYGVPMANSPRAFEPLSPKPLRIIYLGRFAREQKRVHLFPAILDGLKSIPFHWTLAGEGPDEAVLREGMKASSPNQTVSFAGPIAYKDVPALFASHDLFLLASDYEGLPLTLLEAMSAGLVPVVSDLPSGIPEVVDSSTGQLVDPQNTAGYAQAIIALHQDRERMARLSRKALERVRTKFSVSAMTDRWLAVLNRPAPTPLRWPESWRIRAPLAGKGKWRMWPPARFLRRWRKKFGR